MLLRPGPMYRRSLELAVNDLVFLSLEGCNKGNAGKWTGTETENLFDIAEKAE